MEGVYQAAEGFHAERGEGEGEEGQAEDVDMKQHKADKQG